MPENKLLCSASQTVRIPYIMNSKRTKTDENKEKQNGTEILSL